MESLPEGRGRGFVLQQFLTTAYGAGNSFAGSGHFDIALQARDQSSTLIAQNHIVADAIL